MAATAATAATAVASSFTKSIPSLHSIRSKTLPNCDHHNLRVASTRSTLQHEALVFSSPLIQLRVVSRLAAAVAQDEEVAEAQEEVVEEKGSEESDEDGVSTKLYFGNLPYLCDSAQLAGIVQDYASPELVEVLYDRETGKSRGFAFVTMSSVEDCNKVIENLDGKEFGGRTLRVNFSGKPKPKEPLYPETEHKLFIGNLSWSVTSESLAEAFQQYGNVVGARVLYDGETGRSRGYGFVSFETREQMEDALQNLNGVELEGRAMRVSLAEGRKR